MHTEYLQFNYCVNVRFDIYQNMSQIEIEKNMYTATVFEFYDIILSTALVMN